MGDDVDTMRTFVDPVPLHLIRIEDCFGATGGSYEVFFFPTSFGSPFDPVLIRGFVYLAGTTTPAPPMYVLTDSTDSTISDFVGEFRIAINANTEINLDAVGQGFEAVDMVNVPGQPPATTVSDVVIEVIFPDDVFASGFEDGE